MSTPTIQSIWLQVSHENEGGPTVLHEFPVNEAGIDLFRNAAQGVGQQGPTGATGATGAAGASAYAVAVAGGFVGNEAAWLASLVGAEGPQGPTGATGPQGATGSQGIQGVAGPTGPQGPAGNDGAAGATGPQGDAGPQGAQGPQGNAGAQGIQGIQGVAGADGATGPQGPQGDAGPQGPAGDVSACWPVGSVFIAVVSTNPGTLLGFGTWTAFGAGRMIVGLDAGDTDFDTAEETGGAKTVTLTANEMPTHTHTQDAHGHGVTDPGHTHLTQRYPTATGGSSGFTIDTSMSGTLADNTLPTKTATTGLTVNNATATNQNTGGGGAHTNLPPYIVCHLWKRTA